ncbi:MAG: cytochrome b N-terminal domain-containing protein [Isosphaeraceae bacterium]
MSNPDAVVATGPARGVRGWFESRTGLAETLESRRIRPIGFGARIRYILGAALVGGLIVEVVTGLLLMTGYSPSASTAWASTYYIDQVLTAGWLIRGLHNFAAHSMIGVALLYVGFVLISGAYRAPRELNWWTALGILGVLIGFTLTGNALPWDQDGYWAWNVETGIAGGAPVLGPSIRKLILGGPDLGNATLGRLFALHAGLLPLAGAGLLIAHRALSRRHSLAGVRDPERTAGDGFAFFAAIVVAIFLGIAAYLVVLNQGVSLEAPADPSSQYPARPAWFFLWLFELRKFFPGPQELIATMVIPGALTTVLLLLPFLDRILPRGFAHFLACALWFAVLGGAGYLTALSVRIDQADEHFNQETAAADEARRRAFLLAEDGFPPEGAPALLSRDPLYRGSRLFAQKCQGCHAYNQVRTAEGPLAAPEMKGFGTKEWVRDLLENPDTPAFFRDLKKCDPKLAGMANWKKGAGKDLKPEELDQLAAFVGSMADIPPDTPPSVWENSEAVQNDPGYALFADQCASCHLWGEADESNFGPSLYAWGSRGWFRRMLLKPGSPDLYGLVEPTCQMPAFEGQLTEADVEVLYRFVKGDYRR